MRDPTWLEEAEEYFRKGYEAQMQGDLKAAISHYRRSIELCPTAEAHTFLGWAYSHQGNYDEAIRECTVAIQVDPDFGNPYNDIGAYLIEKGRLDDAIPWLEKATKAKRYESYCFPHLNLGRIWEKKGQWSKAIDEYRLALKENPNYVLAARALKRLQAYGHTLLRD